MTEDMLLFSTTMTARSAISPYILVCHRFTSPGLTPVNRSDAAASVTRVLMVVRANRQRRRTMSGQETTCFLVFANKASTTIFDDSAIFYKD